MCFRHTVQLIGGLLWILQQLSPYLQAPILQKNGQFTLSISVPQTFASLSAINILQQIRTKLLFKQDRSHNNYQEVDIKYMKTLLLLPAFLTIQVLSFTLGNSILTRNSPKTASVVQNVGDEIKYNGKGFGADLQAVLSEAITDSAIYYRDSFYSQSNCISQRLKKVKPGDWHVVLVVNLTISKITEVSTGFYYWTEGDTWALWYNTSSFAKQTLHLVLYNGNNGKTTSNVTTQKYKQGSGVEDDTASVIDSIIKSLDTPQDIAKYAQKYDTQKWSVISIPFDWAGKCPEAWATLSVSQTYISYNKNVTLQGKSSSLIIYV